MRKIFFTLALLASLGAAPATYDRLLEDQKPYLSTDDPAGFDMKIRAASASPRALWGGGKRLFFDWCKDNCQDWLSHPDRFVICHGDVHLGNIGVYPASISPVQIDFGLIDFDEAEKLPVEIDLLEACISLRLTAIHAKIELSESDRAHLCQSVIDAFALAGNKTATATEQLKSDPLVAPLFSNSDRTYAHELKKLTKDGRFRTVIAKNGEVRDIQRPAMDRADALASAIAQAAKNSPSLRAALRSVDAVEIRESIRDVALRTHISSAGSQGLEKILLLMNRPLREVDHDAILYLKQQIPSAAQRAGISPDESSSAGQRVSDAIDALCDPPPVVRAWCEVDGKSYSISLHDPWSADLGDAGAENLDDLLKLARIVGTVLGRAHHGCAIAPVLAKRLDDRSTAYLKVLQAEYKSLHDDPRTAPCIARADKWIADAK